MITVILLSLLIAIANVLDMLTDIFAIAIIGINAYQLGLFNAISYIAFMLALYFGSKLSDKGAIKIQVLFTSLCLLIYGITLGFLARATSAHLMVLTTMYVAYSIAQAFARTSAITYIHENYPSAYWERMLARRVAVTIVCEALILVSMSVIGLRVLISHVQYFVLSFMAPSLVTFLLIKDPPLRFERALYTIDVGLSRVERLITANLTVFTLLTEQRTFIRSTAKFSPYIRTGYISAKNILAVAMLFRMANALLLVQLPIYLGRTLGLPSSSLFEIYGLARLLLLVDFLVPLAVSKRVSLAMLIRGALPALLLAYGPNMLGAMMSIVLGTLLYLNSKIDVALYSMYIDSLGRIETTRYLLAGELTGFLATLVSGPVHSAGGYESVILINMGMMLVGSFLLRRRS